MSEKNKKRLNTNSNSYIIIYSTILVLVVAFMLAFVFTALKPMQDANVSLDKKKQILAALNIRNLSDAEATQKYVDVVAADAIIDATGKIVAEGEKGGEKTAFVLNSSDFKAGKLAVYFCEVDGQKKYVLPVYGMGLWGPIWGYLALDDDRNTVFGVYFNHESETAGLGAEIKDSEQWQQQFRGKKIFKAGTQDIGLSVVKKVTDAATQCDGITGATLTMDGVTAMFADCLKEYKVFLTNEMQEE